MNKYKQAAETLRAALKRYNVTLPHDDLDLAIRLLELISRERDAARAEGEAYGRVLAEDADRAVGEILARLTELVEAAEGALHIGVNSEPAHALLIAAVAKAKAL